MKQKYLWGGAALVALGAATGFFAVDYATKNPSSMLARYGMATIMAGLNVNPLGDVGDPVPAEQPDGGTVAVGDHEPAATDDPAEETTEPIQVDIVPPTTVEPPVDFDDVEGSISPSQFIGSGREMDAPMSEAPKAMPFAEGCLGLFSGLFSTPEEISAMPTEEQKPELIPMMPTEDRQNEDVVEPPLDSKKKLDGATTSDDMECLPETPADKPDGHLNADRMDDVRCPQEVPGLEVIIGLKVEVPTPPKPKKKPLLGGCSGHCTGSHCIDDTTVFRHFLNALPEMQPTGQPAQNPGKVKKKLGECVAPTIDTMEFRPSDAGRYPLIFDWPY